MQMRTMENAHNAQKKHSVVRVHAACFSLSYFFVAGASQAGVPFVAGSSIMGRQSMW
jgi:hypothetical protein